MGSMGSAEYLKINQLLPWKVCLFSFEIQGYFEYLDTVWEGGSGMEYLTVGELDLYFLSLFSGELSETPVLPQIVLWSVRCQRGQQWSEPLESQWQGPESREVCPFLGHINTQAPYLPRDSTVRGQLTDKSIPSWKRSEALDTGFLALTLGIRVYVFAPSILTNSGFWKFPFTSSANHDVLATLSNLQVL